MQKKKNTSFLTDITFNSEALLKQISACYA